MAPCQGKPEAVRGITAHNLRAEIIGEVQARNGRRKGSRRVSNAGTLPEFFRRGNQWPNAGMIWELFGAGKEDAKEEGGTDT